MQVLQAQSSTETALPLKNIISMAALWGNEVHNSLYESLSGGPAECVLLESNFISSFLLQGTKSSIFPKHYFIYFKETLNNSFKEDIQSRPSLFVMRVEKVLITII